jgi:DNA-binding transcriptional MerR regulator
MDEMISAGEFEVLTGLTPKALRLYAERGILSPTRADPVTAYRAYDRAQVRHGVSLDLLRRARVPVAELAGAEDFDFDARRQTVAMERLMEDFHLDVAERIAAFDPDDLVAHHDLVPPLDWIGVVIDLGVPGDLDGRLEAFSGLAVDVPAIDRALAEALADVGAPPSAWSGPRCRTPPGAAAGGCSSPGLHRRRWTRVPTTRCDIASGRVRAWPRSPGTRSRSPSNTRTSRSSPAMPRIRPLSIGQPPAPTRSSASSAPPSPGSPSRCTRGAQR